MAMQKRPWWIVVPLFRITAKPATRQGRRASLGTHGPDRTTALIHYAIGDPSPTLQVGQQHTSNRRAGGLIVSSSLRGAVVVQYPISRSGHVLMLS
jgi:hypothetical protein